MKISRGKIIMVFSLFFLIVTFQTSLIVNSQDHGPTDECETAIETVSISSGNELKFDKLKLFVSKDSCVNIQFRNIGEIEHDFSLEREDGSEWLHLHLENKFDNQTGSEPGLVLINLQTPNIDFSFPYYCSVPGHRAAGEFGELIVGEGTQPDTPTHEETESETSASSTSDQLKVPGFQFGFALFTIVTTCIFSVHYNSKFHLRTQ